MGLPLEYRPTVVLGALAVIALCLVPVGLLGWGIAVATTPQVSGTKTECSRAAFNDDGSRFVFARHHTTWVTAPIQLGDSRVVRTEILIRDLDSDTTSLLATSELPTNVHTAWLEWRGERVRYRASGAADSVVEEWAVPHRNTGSPLPEGSAWRDGRHGVPSGVCIAGVEDIAG